MSLYLQGLLAAAQRAEIRDRPVQADQAQQAFHETCRLSERHAEQHLHGQAGLDGRVAVDGPSAALAGGRSLPAHGGIKPALRRLQEIAYRPTDRQRAAALERVVARRPVPGLVGGGCGSAHALQLPHWIHKMNPSREFCNRAPADANVTEVRIRSRLSPQPFQPGTRPSQPTEFQAEPRRRSHRVASTLCGITQSGFGQTETGSHLSDTTQADSVLKLISRSF